MDVIASIYASYTFQAQHYTQQRSVYVTDTVVGSVKICRVQIKQMFIVAICVQKNKHSSNPPSTPLSWTISVCQASVHSELCLSASHTMGSLNAGEKLRRTRQLCITLALFLFPCQRGQAEIRSGALCYLSFFSPSLKQINTPACALISFWQKYSIQWCETA